MSVIVMTILLCLHPHAALACRGWMFETSAVVSILPERIADIPVAAKVKVRSASPEAVVDVVEAIGGTTTGDVVRIGGGGHSCGGGVGTSWVGREGFIAGRLDPTGRFFGEWSEASLSKRRPR